MIFYLMYLKLELTCFPVNWVTLKMLLTKFYSEVYIQLNLIQKSVDRLDGLKMCG